MSWFMPLVPAGTRPQDVEGFVPPQPSAQPPRTALPSRALLIDVRSYSEYMAGHLSGAHCLPLPRLDEHIHSLAPDPGLAIILYCSTGARAEHALGHMQRLGYTQVFNGGSALELARRLDHPIQAGM